MRNVNIYSMPAVWDAISAQFGGEEYFVDIARKLGGPVLEIGSGTGRMVEAISNHGIKCTGLDLAPEMVRFASRKIPNATFIEADMRNFDLGMRFKFIFSANNTMQYLHASDDFLSALRAMRTHLQPDGRFVFSIINPRRERIAPLDKPVKAMSFKDPASQREVIIWETFSFEPETKIGVTRWEHHDQGRPILAYEFPLIFRDHNEVSELCELGGFDLEKIEGDHEGTTFSPGQSRNMVFTLALAD